MSNTPEKFYYLREHLKRLGYSIIESHEKYNAIYIIFDKVYKIVNLPNEFELLNKKMGNCRECKNRCIYNGYYPHSLCTNDADYKTILIHSKGNHSGLKREAIFNEVTLSKAIEDLTEWVNELEKIESDE